MTQQKRVAFLGLGLMKSAMTANLARNGYLVNGIRAYFQH